MPFLLMTLSEMVKGSTSIQRLYEYGESQALEASYDLPEPPANWPKEGSVDVENVSVRYRDGLPLVLKNVSFRVEPQEKVGIVGRTGSGKSTMLLAMTRILELTEDGDLEGEKVGPGGVFIDSVDVSKMGLKFLRQNVTVIPQDPSVFQGTIRYNVDPFEERTDDEIVDALVKSQVWDT